MENQQPPPKNLPPLEVPADLEPVYSNMVRITHSPTEIVIDFARMLPGAPADEVKTRIVMSPLSAKLFYRALTENLSKFESNFGEIKLPGAGTSLAEHLFRPPQK
ncbi:MAG: DUF3467 domain-containing protein [Anaerolineales bacterium]|nr:DUF3467 domain-containing protein [Anaerolineales bacterium]